MLPFPRTLIATLTAVLVGLHGAPIAHASPATSAAADNAAAVTDTLTRQVLDSYRRKDTPTDPRYYADSLWVNGMPQCWTCNVSPGVAAATLATRGSFDPELAAVATQTFDRAVARRQPDGSFTAPGSSSSAGVDTIFFLKELGVAYRILEPHLTADTKARWAAALAAGADYLKAAGHSTWYINGNLNLLITEDFYLAWRATGEQRFRDLYEASWQFTLNPPTPRWAGYGLQVVKQPTRADGSDGIAYLTEASGSRLGFDPAYTEVQSEVAASLWVESGDPRALRLTNMLVNALTPRVDATGTLDARNGSRMSLLQPFMTPALMVAVRDAGRDDLVPLLQTQLTRVGKEYNAALAFSHQNFYRGLSSWLSTKLLAERNPAPAVPAAPAVAPGPAPTAAAATLAAAPRPAIEPPAPAAPSAVPPAIPPVPAAPAAPAPRTHGATTPPPPPAPVTLRAALDRRGVVVRLAGVSAGTVVRAALVDRTAARTALARSAPRAARRPTVEIRLPVWSRDDGWLRRHRRSLRVRVELGGVDGTVVLQQSLTAGR